MEGRFTCSSCKKDFDSENRGYFSPAQGNLCKKCWSKIEKVQEANERKYEEQEEKEFEAKIRKIVNKVLEEKGL